MYRFVQGNDLSQVKYTQVLLTQSNQIHCNQGNPNILATYNMILNVRSMYRPLHLAFIYPKLMKLSGIYWSHQMVM